MGRGDLRRIVLTPAARVFGIDTELGGHRLARPAPPVHSGSHLGVGEGRLATGDAGGVVTDFGLSDLGGAAHRDSRRRGNTAYNAVGGGAGRGGCRWRRVPLGGYRGTGGRGRLLHRRLGTVGLSEVVVHKRFHRGDHLSGVVAGGAENETVTAADLECGDSVEAAGVDPVGGLRAAATDPGVGGEPPHGPRESRGGASVQPVDRLNRELSLQCSVRCGTCLLGRAVCRCAVRRGAGFSLAELSAFGGQRVHRLRDDRVQVRTQTDLHRCGDRPLHEGRRDKPHLAVDHSLEELESGLRAQNRTAEIHEHNHTVRRRYLLDCLHNVSGVGPQVAMVVPGTAGVRQGYRRLVDAGDEFGDSGRQGPAVGYHYQSDHMPLPPGSILAVYTRMLHRPR